MNVHGNVSFELMSSEIKSCNWSCAKICLHCTYAVFVLVVKPPGKSCVSLWCGHTTSAGATYCAAASPRLDHHSTKGKLRIYTQINGCSSPNTETQVHSPFLLTRGSSHPLRTSHLSDSIKSWEQIGDSVIGSNAWRSINYVPTSSNIKIFFL